MLDALLPKRQKKLTWIGLKWRDWPDPATAAQIQQTVNFAKLHQAAADGNLSAVKALLASGIDVNARDADGQTALVAALSHPDTERQKQDQSAVARFLLENGASDVCSALLLASSGGYTEIVRFLLEKGIDVNLQDNYGYSALYQAAGFNHADIVKLLLAAKADVNIRNKNGVTALHATAYPGYADIVRLLLAAKADVNVRNKNGETPLRQAREQRRAETIKLLEKAGAKE